MVDYLKIAQLQAQPEAPKRKIPDDYLMEVANGMAQWGYQFTEESAKALVAYFSNKSLLFIGKDRACGSLFFKALSEFGQEVGTSRRREFQFAVVFPTLASLVSTERLRRFLSSHREVELVIDGIDEETPKTLLSTVLEFRRCSAKRTHFIVTGQPDCKVMEMIGGFSHDLEMFNINRDYTNDTTGSRSLTNTFYYSILGLWTGKEIED